MKRALVLTAAVVAAFAVTSFPVSTAAGQSSNSTTNWAHHDSDDKPDPRIQRGFEIAPVPLHYDRDDHDEVGLGSYLVNAVGGCNDCHTNPSYAPGHDPFMGQPKQVNTANYLGGGQQFGPFVSRNLTPENGLPAGRTYKQFLLILRTGVDLDHLHPQISPLLQVMPWPTYQNMKTSDIKAIYEYLKAIPPAPAGK